MTGHIIIRINQTTFSILKTVDFYSRSGIDTSYRNGEFLVLAASGFPLLWRMTSVTSVAAVLDFRSE